MTLTRLHGKSPTYHGLSSWIFSFSCFGVVHLLPTLPSPCLCTSTILWNKREFTIFRSFLVLHWAKPFIFGQFISRYYFWCVSMILSKLLDICSSKMKIFFRTDARVRRIAFLVAVRFFDPHDFLPICWTMVQVEMGSFFRTVACSKEFFIHRFIVTQQTRLIPCICHWLPYTLAQLNVINIRISFHIYLFLCPFLKRSCWWFVIGHYKL